MSEPAHSHKPTTKHVNKPFKSRTATKGDLKKTSKGRTQKLKARSSAKAQESKASRKNKAKQLQRAKANKVEVHAPRVVAVLSLCSDANPTSALASIVPADTIFEQSGIHYAQSGSTLLQFLTPAYNDLMANIGACLAADFVILCLSSSVEVEHYGENLLRCLTSLGVPESGIRACLPSLPREETSTTHAHIRKSLLSYINHFFPTLDKIHILEEAADVTNLMRSFKETTPKGVVWREERSRILVEDVAFANGSLQITGSTRGAPLNVNNLLHIPGYGDVQIAKVERAAPYSSKGKQKHTTSFSMDTEPSATLAEADADAADDLQSLNEPDPEDLLLAEQTWPTEEEMEGGPRRTHDGIPDAAIGTTPKHIRRVPKGTSEYQAAWILDEGSAPDDESEEEEASDDESMGAPSTSGHQMEDDDETEGMQTGTVAESTLGDGGYEAYKSSRRAQAQDDADFPDEVDTPQDRLARERFAKYRGLKSFRTSAWDPFENLPQDYSKCFMFENYKSMSRNVVHRAAENGIDVGTRVVVHLKDVPQEAVALFQKPNHPLTVFALHKHEHKFTVVHFSVNRNTEYEEEVRSKDPVILLLGPRRFLVEPIFSGQTQRNNGKGVNNVHKFHRFVQHGSPAVGTTYLPVTFGSSTPALLLQPESLDLISSGSLLGSDPTRVVAKRIILTGHPYKLHKRTATIRYMFFNTEDILYFKPIELHTKKGRKGHIKESLGTHGFFKAMFDGPIDQMDTVCLNLYKRCFPKWGKLLRAPAEEEGKEVQEVEMED